MGDVGLDETVASPGALAGGRPLAPGTRVGEYEVERPLGRGGMGEVYAAVHPLIGKRAAIKVMRPELSSDPAAVERFLQEARAVNQIEHPNLVDVFSFGRLPDGRCYQIMELLEGESLGAMIRRKRLRLGEVLAILEIVCVGLEAAHARGVIHRDLKPDNVFLVKQRDGRTVVKLLDFGLAKLIRGDDVRLTQSGQMVGTPAYLAPEQAKGQRVDAAADVYALGAMAFELLTGELPFAAGSAMEMVSKHLTEPPPSARARVAGLPAEIDALVTTMMAKDRAARPSLDEVRRAIAQARAVEASGGGGSRSELAFAPTGAVTPVARARWKRPAAIAVGVIGLAALLLLLPWRCQRRDASVAETPTDAATVIARVVAPPLDARPVDAASAPPPVDAAPAPPIDATAPVSPRPRRRDVAPTAPIEADAPDPDGYGLLIAFTSPWAKVSVDGKDTGKMTPVTKRSAIKLSAGKHKVTFRVGPESWTYSVTIVAGETTKLTKELPVSEP